MKRTAQAGEEDVDEEISSAAGLKEDSKGREDDGKDLFENDG